MSLFPAYAKDSLEVHVSNAKCDVTEVVSLADIDACSTLTTALETELLASDTEEELPAFQAPSPPSSESQEFYVDSKRDSGNLRVSTLYYPGRPEYRRCGRAAARGPEGRRARRYYERAEWGAGARGTSAGGEAARAALAAAEQEHARHPRSPHALTALLHAARQALPAQQYAARLRDYIHNEKDLELKCVLWEHVLEAAAADGGGADAVSVLAGAAMRELRALPAAYPRVVHACGALLRAAGLWERLVLLVELLAAMNLPAGAFPPERTAATEAAGEARLAEVEERAVSSALPLSVVWGRVERARAAQRWRAGRAAAADPQRAPLPADVADLLLPVVDAPTLFLLSVQMLRLAKVPLLPGAGYVVRGVGGTAGAERAGRAAEGEALLALLRAARRLPPAHAARAPAAARRLLALAIDPPHYVSDEHGFLSWVTALWEACCARAAGTAGTALLCWRLRWLHALALLGDEAEARRVRAEGRAALRRLAGGSPLPFAHFARLELVAGGAEGRTRATRTTLHALRHALHAEPPHPHHHLLYLARVAHEVSGGAEEGRWALCAAVLRREPPAGAPPTGAPPAHWLQDARALCEERCEELERRYSSEVDGEDGTYEEDPVQAFLPSEAEWACARVLLADGERRAALLRRALGAGAAGVAQEGRGVRYAEQEACALADGAGAAVAGALAALHPHNAYLAVAGSAAPLGAGGPAQARARLTALATPSTDTAALAALLPSLLRALGAAGEGDAEREGWAQRATRVARRVCGAGAARGALVWALRLESEGLAGGAGAQAALLAALDALPHHKWLHVRGSGCAPLADELPDLLLDKQLRLHALRDELLPLPQPPR